MSEPTDNDETVSAETALAMFRAITGTDYEDALCDRLCDLMLWADRTEPNFEAELARRRHYAAELLEAEGVP